MRNLFSTPPFVVAGLLVLPASLAFGLFDEPKEKPKSDTGVAASEKALDYLRDVRPILAQHCFQCHGPDEQKRKGKLRLDLKEEALAERKESKVIDPGHPDASLVYQRIIHENDKKRMPPPDKGEPLSEKKIEILRKWIEQGANFTEHWAFQPLAKPATPEVINKEWPKDVIDNFILSRLEKEGLKPSAEATKESWLRRATFDITGLPPTTKEIDEFLKDNSAEAYEKVADRLLASPRYGERQAQEWLDVARYADSNGYQNDGSRNIWKWREWVINAYNANMPFDQFTIEQLAGDLLPNATLDQKIATGFNRNHPTNSEAGEEEDEYRSAYVIDRVNTTATTFLGLTLACTQCHDHKYDPLTQKDYYQFYAYFNNIKERDADFSNPRPTLPAPNPDQAARLKDLQAKIKTLEKRLETEDPLTNEAQKEWEAKTVSRLANETKWVTAEPAGMLSRYGSILKRLDDGSILSTGPTPVRDTYDLVFQPGVRHISAIRIEVLPDPSNPYEASGRASDGRFILNAIEIKNSTLSESSDPPILYISKAEADLNQKMKEDDLDASFFEMPGNVDSAVITEAVKTGDVDGGEGSRSFRGGWSITGYDRKIAHEAVLLPMEAFDTNESSVLRISLHHTSTNKFKSLIGRFRISFTDDDHFRTVMLPVLGKHWNMVGPFASEDVEKAFTTSFGPETDLIKTNAADLKKQYDKPVVAINNAEGPGGASKNPGAGAPAGTPNADAANIIKEKPKAESKDADGEPKAKEVEKPKVSDKSKEAEESKEKAAPATDVKIAASDEPKDSAPATPAAEGEKPNFGKGKGKGKFNKEDSEKIAAKNESQEPAAKDDSKASPEKNEDATEKKDTKIAVADKKDEKAPEKVTVKKDEKADDKKDAAPVAAGRDRKKEEKLAWKEQPTWRDGRAGRLQNTSNSAVYLARTIISTEPRTVTMKFDGPAGLRVWLNGEKVYEVAPPPPPAPKKEEPKKDVTKEKDKDKEPEEEEFDFENFDFFGRNQQKDAKTVKLGLRAGSNEIVVKAVYGAAAPQGGRGMGGMFMFGGGGAMMGGGGGGSFTFDIIPEGDDIINHEVATALRREAAEKLNIINNPAGGTGAPAPARSAETQKPTGENLPPMQDDKISPTAAPAVSNNSLAKLNAPDVTKTLEAPDEVEKVGEQKQDESPKYEKPKLSDSELRKKTIREYYRTRVDTVGRVIFDELERARDEERKLKREIPETLVMAEREKPRESYIFKRGVYKNKGEKVEPGTPAVLPAIAADLPKNRLGLAKWIVAKENPLTSRVLVNRIWQQYFGAGMVLSAEDFGIRSDLPSHPELLDYLASELLDNAWNLKALHRRIILSAVYRQTSVTTPELLEKDPENRLLARAPRARLSAEMIRDNALAVSGLLVEKIGGKSVKPYQPKGLWKAISGGSDYKKDKDESQYRRGIYVFWKRGVPYPSMITFDAAKRESCTVTRAYTTTPLQALVLLNDPVYVECAKMLGQRMLKDREAGKDDAARLKYGFRLCTSRAASEKEIEILTKLLADQREYYKTNAELAKKLITVGDAKVDEKLPEAEIAAWAMVGNALLNLDAAIRKG
ncbi:MAG: DUF1553 domain-containing protein [Planctomycetota bacterium]